MAISRGFIRPHLVAIRYFIVATVVLGIAYPVAILGIGQVALPSQANGSIISTNGKPVGSSLIGQTFADADGVALAEWFQSRPSAAGYDGSASTGSNLGPENPHLVAEIKDRRAEIAGSDANAQVDIPADALTTSASGLDPHISPEYAFAQVSRVAEARGLDESTLFDLVTAHTQGRDLGYLGEERVNVLELNVALSQLDE